MNKSVVHLFHIAYSYETMEMIPPGFKLLDHMDNTHSDWFESWPIRHYLQTHALDEDAYYGFLSPRFFLKTGLTANDLRQSIAGESESVEAFFVCPQPDVGAFFLNPVYGMDFSDPGALDCMQSILNKAGLDLNLQTMLIDSTQLSYSNYVIAKPSYWRRWLKLLEYFYMYAETDQAPELKTSLSHPTNYNNGVHRKVFLVECLPTILFHYFRLKVKSIPLNHALAGQGVLYPYVQQAKVCDAMKMAFKSTGDMQFMHIFQETANSVLSNFSRPAYVP